MKEVSLITHRRTEFLDITSLVQDALARTCAGEGICFIYCPHTTAGLMINERADPAVVHDIGSFLEECVLEDHPLTHAEGNSPAHVKAALIGGSVQVAFEEKGNSFRGGGRESSSPSLTARESGRSGLRSHLDSAGPLR